MREPVTFSVNMHDDEGDVWMNGIFLHFGDTTILVAKTMSEFSEFCDRLISMKPEIMENYNVPS